MDRGNPALAQFILSTGSALTVVLLTFIAVSVRKGVKKFFGEHDWLMKTVEADTKAIKKILEHQEKAQ